MAENETTAAATTPVFEFLGVKYDLTPEQGAKMVATYRDPAFGFTDNVIAGMLSKFKSQVQQVVRADAEKTFAELLAKVDADATVQKLQPQIQATFKRYSEIGKKLDELDEQVIAVAMNLARQLGLTEDGFHIGFTAEDHKLTMSPAKKSGGTGTGHGGSVAGRVVFHMAEIRYNGETFSGTKEECALWLHNQKGIQFDLTAPKKNDKGEIQKNPDGTNKTVHITLSKSADGKSTYYPKWLDALSSAHIITIVRQYNKDGSEKSS